MHDSDTESTEELDFKEILQQGDLADACFKATLGDTIQLEEFLQKYDLSEVRFNEPLPEYDFKTPLLMITEAARAHEYQLMLFLLEKVPPEKLNFSFQNKGKEGWHHSPLHEMALFCQESTDADFVLQEILKAYQPMVPNPLNFNLEAKGKKYTGRTPLHLLCNNHDCENAILSVLENYPLHQLDFNKTKKESDMSAFDMLIRESVDAENMELLCKVISLYAPLKLDFNRISRGLKSYYNQLSNGQDQFLTNSQYFTGLTPLTFFLRLNFIEELSPFANNLTKAVLNEIPNELLRFNTELNQQHPPITTLTCFTRDAYLYGDFNPLLKVLAKVPLSQLDFSGLSWFNPPDEYDDTDPLNFIESNNAGHPFVEGLLAREPYMNFCFTLSHMHDLFISDVRDFNYDKYAALCTVFHSMLRKVKEFPTDTLCEMVSIFIKDKPANKLMLFFNKTGEDSPLSDMANEFLRKYAPSALLETFGGPSILHALRRREEGKSNGNVISYRKTPKP